LAPLITLIAEAKPAQLSRYGEAERLSRLPEFDAAVEIAEVAKRVGILAGDLRKEVAKRRRQKTKRAGDDEVDTIAGKIPVDRPWTDPLPPLATILDGIVRQLQRLVCAHPSRLPHKDYLADQPAARSAKQGREQRQDNRAGNRPRAGAQRGRQLLDHARRGLPANQ